MELLDRLGVPLMHRPPARQLGGAPRALKTNQAADFLDEKQRWVRDHKDALGAVKKDGRLWFPVERLEEIRKQRLGTESRPPQHKFVAKHRRETHQPPSSGGTP